MFISIKKGMWLVWCGCSVYNFKFCAKEIICGIMAWKSRADTSTYRVMKSANNKNSNPEQQDVANRIIPLLNLSHGNAHYI